MRWNNLLSEPSGEDELTQPLFSQGAVVRRFDTPDFKGITFYEVMAKSIINKVPESSRVPFRWTINPYRGCSHACLYCLSGDTRILMEDGRTKPLADLRVGDVVFGTKLEGRHRRYVTTTVMAHWATVKPAYRISLEDATELVASGDHRFLSDQGWKFLGDIPGRSASRLSLTDRLIGIGAFGDPGRILEGRRAGPISSLRVAAIKELHMEMPMFDVTTGTGDFIANGVVSHNCFARNTHTYLDLDAGQDFNSRIVVKVNAGERLRKELAAKSWKGEHIAMGTNVDPYQRAEGRYRLMRDILPELRDTENPFSILTKGSLILRDLDLLQECADVADIGTNVSVGCVDRELWRALEPGTPSPQKRLEVCAKLNEAGIPCGVLMAPIIPFLSDSDEHLGATVQAIAESGAGHVSPIVLHLRPGAREWFMKWLAENHLSLVPKYERLYANRAYAPKAYQVEVAGKVHALAAEFGVGRAVPQEARRIRERVAQATGRMKAEQLSLL